MEFWISTVPLYPPSTGYWLLNREQVTLVVDLLSSVTVELVIENLAPSSVALKRTTEEYPISVLPIVPTILSLEMDRVLFSPDSEVIVRFPLRMNETLTVSTIFSLSVMVAPASPTKISPLASASFMMSSAVETSLFPVIGVYPLLGSAAGFVESPTAASDGRATANTQTTIAMMAIAASSFVCLPFSFILAIIAAYVRNFINSVDSW